MSTDLLTALLAACDRFGDAPAIAASRAALTYRQLGERIRATAAGLRAAGLEPGDRVLFSVRPSPEGIVLALGIVRAGGVVVFADPGVGPELFAARFEAAAPRWAAAESLLYTASSLAVVRPLTRRRGLLLPEYRTLPVRHIYSGRWLPGVPRRALSARRLAGSAAPAVAEPATGADHEALIVFTSGTTAAPKAVVHTRLSLGAGLAMLGDRCAIGPGDVLHTDQLMLGLPALVNGAQWTLPPYGFAPAADPVRYAAGLARATHTFCVPADLAALVHALDNGTVPPSPTLRVVVVGGAPVPPALVRAATQALPGAELLAVYGMTEILPIATATAADKLGHPGPGDMAGVALPGITATLTDEGELVVAGPNLCRGYLGEPPMLSHATGDLATLDGGRVILLGRKKDMLIRGRVNIYPGLYEPSIAALPGVAQAAFVGVPDEFGDERVVLAVVAAGSDGPPRVLDNHPLAVSVRAALPRLIDASAQPDDVVVLAALPVAGRARKPDRAALRSLVGARCVSR
jgi:acyl-CoA synthetase (AMP-forming)/AMP-acid ligase II